MNSVDFSQTQVFVSFWKATSNLCYAPSSDSSGHEQYGVIRGHKDRYIEHIFFGQSPTYNNKQLLSFCFQGNIEHTL